MLLLNKEVKSMFHTLNATDVRRDWSAVIDTVVREKPAFIKRTRDQLILANTSTLMTLLEAYSFSASQFMEDDGSITISLDAIDLAENALTLQEAVNKMASAILEYATDYYNDFAFWSRGNRVSHVPYVLKALILNDLQKIGELIKCQPGKS